MLSQEKIDISFPQVDREGNLISYDGGLELLLPSSEVVIDFFDLKKRRVANRIGTYSCVVESVDEEKGLVTVSYDKVKAGAKAKVEEAIKESAVVLPARVIKVYNTIAIIDIGGLGIPGYVMIKNWSRGYTNDFMSVAKRGDIIDVLVGALENDLDSDQRKKYFPRVPGNIYQCSRKDAVADPWIGIEDKFAAGHIVDVVVTENTQQNHFYGYIEGIPEISIYGQYPNEESYLNKEDIEVGKKYQCYVFKIDAKEHIFRARAFRESKA